MINNKDAIEFKLIRRLAVLGPSGKNWAVELNLVSWNAREPKLDIRSWDPSHERMGKGIALSHEEAEKLRDALTVYLAE